MTTPRFFSRIADALTPVAGLDPDALAAHLDTVTVHIHAPEDTDQGRATLLAVNLAARLYPHVALHGDSTWLTEAHALATGIYPDIDISTTATAGLPAPGATVSDDDDGSQATADAAATRRDLHLAWNAAGSADIVGISACGWIASIDAVDGPRDGPGDRSSDDSQYSTAHPLTCAAAVALGMGEVFRAAFAQALGERGRTGPQPGSLNLITGDTAARTVDLLAGDEWILPDVIELPAVTLVGAGAVGQACLWALIHANVQATVTVVDPEPVTLSNLQRYLLTDDTHVGTSKVDLAQTAAATSPLTVIPVPTAWGADDRTGPGTPRVLVALDTAADRLAVAAALPEAVYNAWTQPADIGWSRHEHFGTEPCLACLYYPDRPRPSEHELIAAALQDHPLRVLTYLVTNTPVGSPLALLVSLPDIPPPAGAEQWRVTSLLDDLIARGRVTPEQSAQWRSLGIAHLYRDGVCAGGLIHIPGSHQPDDALVPLAHQSALAGIMLATTYIASRVPALRAHRSAAIEARFDVLRGFPQMINRPRQRTPGCFCTDSTYLSNVHEPDQTVRADPAPPGP